MAFSAEIEQLHKPSSAFATDKAGKMRQHLGRLCGGLPDLFAAAKSSDPGTTGFYEPFDSQARMIAGFTVWWAVI
jgi:hypothetical protein